MRLEFERADAARSDRVAVICALERNQLVTAGVRDRKLQRELDGLGAPDTAIRAAEISWRDIDQTARELRPRCVRRLRCDIRWTFEALHASENFGRVPSEVADAPAHLEIDERAPARVAHVT